MNYLFYGPAGQDNLTKYEHSKILFMNGSSSRDNKGLIEFLLTQLLAQNKSVLRTQIFQLFGYWLIYKLYGKSPCKFTN